MILMIISEKIEAKGATWSSKTQIKRSQRKTKSEIVTHRLSCFGISHEKINRFETCVKLNDIKLLVFPFKKNCFFYFRNREEDADMVPYVRAFNSITVKENETDDDIIFRKNQFKPNRELMVLPSKALKILDKRFRTDDEANFLCRCLRVLKRFNEFPESVQMKLAHRLVYQKYEEKRILLREGHRPEGMYFVVTGRAIELTLDFDGYSARPSFLVEQGDVFGESELLSKSKRPKTWISQTSISILYLRAEVNDKLIPKKTTLIFVSFFF